MRTSSTPRSRRCITTLQDDELPQIPELQIIFDKVYLPLRRASNTTTCSGSCSRRPARPAVLAGSTAIATGKLAQMANGFVYPADGTALYIHDEKRNWVEDIIEFRQRTDAPDL